MRKNRLPGIELANGDCAAVLPGLTPADLILTSPPYDHLREYDGYNGAFDFDAISAASTANLAPGGVPVWAVGYPIIDGGGSGTSFRQALGFMDMGLIPHPTLIYQISSWTFPGDLVIDPMAGNGTTLRAAADWGRQAIRIAINPEYRGLIRRRMAQSVLPVGI